MYAKYNSGEKVVRLTEASSPKYSLSHGRNYLVLAITVMAADEMNPSRVLYQVLNDFGGISHVPAKLFDISDGRGSASWMARHENDGSFLLWPREFFVEYFHDDLSEGRLAAMEIFDRVVTRLKSEASSSEELSSSSQPR